MGVTKKLPPVKLFNGWFDEHTYFKLDKPPINVSDVLDLIYSTLSEHMYEKTNNETVEEYDDKCYKKQYQEYTKNHSKFPLDSP
eukprot:6289060-Ditylum_brightwellii.AAC.1